MAEKEVFSGEIANAINYNEIAKKILEIIPIYYDKSKMWYKYDKLKYKWDIVDEIEILNSIDKELRIANVSRGDVKNQLLNALMMEARKKAPIELDENKVQFINKIVDINTGEGFEASPKYFTFNPIPHKLGDIENTPLIDKYFNDWVGEKYLTLQQWSAYHLLRNYPIHRVLCAVGRGANGKTKYLNFNRKLLGEDNTKGSDFSSVFMSPHGTTALYRKLGLIIGETNFEVLSKTNTFKSATGGDPISLRFLYKESFDYVNYGKISINTNSLPISEDKTDGFFRRWLIVEFPNQFKETGYDILNDIPEWEYENFLRKCLRLLKELLEKQSEEKFSG